MKMEKVKLSIGLFDKDSKKQEIETIDALNLIEQAIIATGAKGLSVYHGNGVYMHDDGYLVKEPSVFAEIYGWEESAMKEAIRFIKRELNQESIAVEQAQVKINFM